MEVCPVQSKPNSYLLLHSANIVTCNEFKLKTKATLSYYRWLVCSRGSNGIVIDIGTDSTNGEKARLAQWKEKIPLQQQISGKDKLVIPGLWDAHCHAYMLGHMAMKVADLSHSASIEDMQNRLRKRLSDFNNKVSTYLEGVQWDQEEMGRFPNRSDLDSVTTEFPVITHRRCWHVVCVNSKALEICGIDNSKVGEEGVDVDEKTGEPTGVLRENAIELLSKLLKMEDSKVEKLKFSLDAFQTFARNGIVGIQTNDSATLTQISDAWEVYTEVMRKRLELNSEHAEDVHEPIAPLPCRVFLTNEYSELRPENNRNNKVPKPPTSAHPNWLSSQRTKLILDGALGPSTAAVSEPYSDDPTHQNKGMLSMSNDQIKEAFNLANKANYRLEAHAIGDAAFENLLTGLENYEHCSRPVVTHCQITNPKLLERIKKYNEAEPNADKIGSSPLIANIQPQFCKSDLPIVLKRLGQDRVQKYCYIWKKLQDDFGCVLAGGSDAPVEPPHSLQGLKDLMKNVIHGNGEEDLTFPEALAAYTSNAAYAAGDGFEDKMGRLSIGYTADFVLTDIEGWEIPRDEDVVMESKLEDMSKHVMQTFVGGVCVFDHEKIDYSTSQSILTGPNGPGKTGRPLWSCPCCM